jgi:nucleoside-diphosphate-sugar epimerase
MKILLTGSNGFLGKYIFKNISKENQVLTLNRTNSNYNYDLSKEIPYLDENIEIVIHSAGLAHTYSNDNNQFFINNVIATKNLLTSLTDNVSLKKIIFISSVSVYGLESGKNITEEYPLLAKDPYGISKIQSEKLIIEWCLEKSINFIILRLPLIVGDNPPGNLQNMINGLKKGYYFNIGKGDAQKSMVLAEDIADVILNINCNSSIFNLTDTLHPTFYDLSNAIAHKFNYQKPKSIPIFAAKYFSKFGDYFGTNFFFNTKKYKKIINTLTFSSDKAKDTFHWDPKSVLDYFNK